MNLITIKPNPRLKKRIVKKQLPIETFGNYVMGYTTTPPKCQLCNKVAHNTTGGRNPKRRKSEWVARIFSNGTGHVCCKHHEFYVKNPIYAELLEKFVFNLNSSNMNFNIIKQISKFDLWYKENRFDLIPIDTLIDTIKVPKGFIDD